MEYRFLGKSGLRVSVLSYGAWVTFNDQIGNDIAYDCMKAAYDAGVNFFDNAEGYSAGEAEKMMGKVVKKAGWKRSDLVISTKIFFGGNGINDKGLSRKHIIEGTDAALKRLDMEYVDLVFCHRPDFYTPMEETVRAMNHVINQGKALYWGTSEWTATQIMEAYEIARREHMLPPLMEQPQYNMFTRQRVEKEYLPLFKKIGLGTTIWSPLMSGLLTGKYNSGIPKDSRLALDGYEWLKDSILSEKGKMYIEKVKLLTKLAEELSISMADLALAWTAKNPNVSTVITGASKAQQVKDNMKVIDYLVLLTPEVMEKIEQILDNKPVLDRDWRF